MMRSTSPEAAPQNEFSDHISRREAIRKLFLKATTVTATIAGFPMYASALRKAEGISASSNSEALEIGKHAYYELQKKGFLEEAIKNYILAIEKDPFFMSAYIAKAKCEYEIGRYDHCIASSYQLLEVMAEVIKRDDPRKQMITKDDVGQTAQRIWNAHADIHNKCMAEFKVRSGVDSYQIPGRPELKPGVVCEAWVHDNWRKRPPTDQIFYKIYLHVYDIRNVTFPTPQGREKTHTFPVVEGQIGSKGEIITPNNKCYDPGEITYFLPDINRMKVVTSPELTRRVIEAGDRAHEEAFAARMAREKEERRRLARQRQAAAARTSSNEDWENYHRRFQESIRAGCRDMFGSPTEALRTRRCARYR